MAVAAGFVPQRSLRRLGGLIKGQSLIEPIRIFD